MKKRFLKAKVCAKVFTALFLLFFSLSAFSCASSKVSKSQPEGEKEEEPLLFADWQYKGFGQEYPQWAESALKEGPSSTIEIHFGENLDMLLSHEAEEADENIVKQIWVYIDPYYEEYEERYVYITLRQAQGSQGMEE